MLTPILRMYDCTNPLCDAYAPCDGVDSQYDYCGCALRRTAYWSSVAPFYDCSHQNCDTGQYFCGPVSDSLCTFEPDNSSCPDFLNWCAKVPSYANFYYSEPVPYLKTWQSVPYDPDAGLDTSTAVQCNATGRWDSCLFFRRASLTALQVLQMRPSPLHRDCVVQRPWVGH